jgi:hypothetical protein
MKVGTRRADATAQQESKQTGDTESKSSTQSFGVTLSGLLNVQEVSDEILNPSMEQPIQRQLYRGAFPEPTELLDHALIGAETADEGWLQRNREAVHAYLDRTFAQATSGEGHSAEESRAFLSRNRATRAA